MRIRSIHVEGFGLLQDKTLQLDQPLTVLYGPNEAGKSTLMGFIRAVLFGFAARSTAAERYEPLHGAVHGGTLTLVTAEGECVRVERREGASASAGRARSPGGGNVRVTLESGAQGGAELLQPLLGGITGELFRSLFAFSLSELQEVRTLQSDELSGYLYSAGLGARGSTIMAAERKLLLSMEQLYRPRGKNQALGQTLLKLEAQEADLRRSKEQAGRYNERVAVLAELDLQITQADTAIREQRTELAWLEAAEQARGHWLRSNEIGQALSTLPVFESFPEEAMMRWNDLAKERERLIAERSKLQLTLEQLQSEREQLIADPAVLDHQIELDGLLDQVTVYRSDQFAESELKIELEHQQMQINALLRQIEAHWDESTLADFAVTLFHREQVRQYRQSLERFQREEEQSAHEVARLTSETEEVKGKLAKLETNLLQRRHHLDYNLTDEARKEMEALPANLMQIRKQHQQRDKLRMELRHLEQREQDYVLQSQGGQAPAADNAALKQLRWLIIAVNLAIPVYLYLQHQPIPALISFVILFAVTLFTFVQSNKAASNRSSHLSAAARRSVRPFGAVNRTVSPFQTERTSLEQQLEPLENSLNERMNQLRGLVHAASVSEQSEPIFIKLTPQTTIQDDQIEQLLDALQQASDHWREGQQQLKIEMQRKDEAFEQYVLLEKHRTEAEDKRQLISMKLAEQTKSWQAWLMQQQLSAQLSPTAVLEIFQIVEQGQQILQLKHKNQAKRQALQHKNAKFERQVCLLLGDASAADLTLALKKWKEAAEQAVATLQLQQRLENQLKQINSEQMLIIDALVRNEQRIDEIFEEADAVDEQEFRLHVRQHTERMALLEELQQIETALDVFIGPTRKPHLDALMLETTLEALRLKLAEISQSLNEAVTQLDNKREYRGKLRSELEKLEQGAEHSDRLQQIQEQAAVLAEQAGQWAKLAFCSALFKKARELYERERQPGVLLQATAYFRQITHGEYVRVLVPLGEKKIVVQHVSGRTMDSALLSRGTAEQLYLSMRFALADEYARKASLPLIMDDILVNFDRERLNNTISVLAKVSEKHQVMFFTCHPHVAEAFAAQIPTHQRINLSS